MRGIDGMKSVFRLDVETVDVIEPAIPGFCDDGQRPPIARGIWLAVIDAPLNDGIANDSDDVSVGDHHGPFEKSRFFHPSRAGHFAIAVQRPPAGEDRIVPRIFSARKDRGHSRSDRPLPNLQFSLAGDERGMSEADAGNVADGVEGAGRAVKRDAEIPRSRPGRPSLLSRSQRYCRERAKKNDQRAKTI